MDSLVFLIKQTIFRGLNEPQSALALAMFMGDRASLSWQWKQIIIQAGLSHLLAVSGFHLSFWFSFLLPFFGFYFPRRQAYAWSVIAILFYLCLIGWPASALRAFLMALIAFGSFAFKTQKHSLVALLSSALLSLIVKPRWLFSLSWQLSHLAVLGIILLSPWGQKCRFKNRFLQYIFNTVWVTFSAQILIGPLLLNSFGQLPLISLVSNPLVSWLMPFILLSILGATLISLILPFLASIIFGPAFLFLSTFLMIAKSVSRVPLNISGPLSPLGVIIYYLLFIILYLYFTPSKNRPF